MEEKRLKNEVRFALWQVNRERKVIEAFAKDPTNENVASVTLEVAGVEHLIVIHEDDCKDFAELLLKFNRKEEQRIVGSEYFAKAAEKMKERVAPIVGLGVAYAHSMLDIVGRVRAAIL